MSRRSSQDHRGWPTPTSTIRPRSAAIDTVVIDVGAAGVSFPDLLLLRGEYQLRLEPPFIPGMEVAGVVRSAPVRVGIHSRANG